MGKAYAKITYLTSLPQFIVRYKPVSTVHHGTRAALLHSLGKSSSSLCYICAAGDTCICLSRNPSTDVRKFEWKLKIQFFFELFCVLSCSHSKVSVFGFGLVTSEQIWPDRVMLSHRSFQDSLTCIQSVFVLLLFACSICVKSSQ